MNFEILDRPIWNSLSTRHAQHAIGTERALRFTPNISPFASLPDDSPESLMALTDLIDPNGHIMTVQAPEIVVPPGTEAAETGLAVQMIAGDFRGEDPSDEDIVRLTDEDAPQMLRLATMTEPGPFCIDTHRLGEFWGVKDNGKLIAMAGERLKHPGLTELSGVCTHPDARGRGLARKLSTKVVAHIVARGEIPYLHAYAHNASAIALYKSLGFKRRCFMNVAKLVRASGP